MTKEDIIRIYEKANGWSPAEFPKTMDELERFAKLVAEHTLMNIDPSKFMSWQESYEAGVTAEREACAKVCEMLDVANPKGKSWDEGTIDCANAIRARGQA